MTIHLSILLFLPLVAGLVSAFAPPRIGRWIVFLGTVAVLAYAVVLLVDFEDGAGLQYVTDDAWIEELGIRYSLGIDGLSLFMVLLTAISWTVCTLAACLGTYERPGLFFFWLAAAETAVLGAFLAQDLVLFIVFFDLMLIPFYFLIGGWGAGERVRATTKFVIYTLSGSLLMLAAAIALGVLATPAGGDISFSIAVLEQRTLGEGSQDWIFLLFALAFLVKAPLFPVHGWMPDTYRSTPIVVLALLSGVLSKVGAYGFLRIVLPVLPDAAAQFQHLLIGLAVFSILYGSILAFSQDNMRLVLGYSSIAQLGFIVLGIFAFDDKGANGAVLQMLNHGLVLVPLFLIIGAIAVRANGSESLDGLGGMAFRAPVLATFFLILTFATLAMPGSANFAGEILILFGTFEHNFVWGVIASLGVALAAVYMIRVFQRSMHNRVGTKVESRDVGARELVAIVPVVAIVVALGIYPHFVTERTDAATSAKVAQVNPSTEVTEAK